MKKWGIDLSESIRLVENHTQVSFDGENYRYTVFDC